MLDTSASMDTKLPTAQEAAIGFVRRLRAQDLAEIIDFDSRVTIGAPFTANAAELEQAIRKTSAGGSTSLYNAIYIALKDLKKIVARNVEEIRRRAIVVLSDGEDTSSLLPFEEVLDLAKRSETAIYAIGLRSADVDREQGLQGSRVRPAAVRAGNRRARLLPESGARSRQDLRRDFRRAVEPVHRRLHVAQSAPRRRLASRRRPHQRTSADAANQARVLRADGYGSGERITTHRPMHEPRSPGALRRGARRLHLAFRQAERRGRPRGHHRARLRGAQPHVRHRHADRRIRSRADRRTDLGDLDLRVAARPRLSLHRDDERRARHGDLHPAAARRAAGDPRVGPRRREPLGGAGGTAVRHSRLVAAVRLRELRAGVRHRDYLRAAVQGDQGQAPRASSTPGCRRCRSSIA